MVLNSQPVKRCAIFLFYDKDGIVDDYIVYLLNDLHKNTDYILAVCNGYVNPEGMKKLSSAADEVLPRVNAGMDVGGYREGMFYLGFRQLKQYDELIILNYTFFGPLFPFSEMFDAMNGRDLDFWGITKHHYVPFDPIRNDPSGNLPEHIQSYFMVFRRDFFMSYNFRDFFINSENPKTRDSSIIKFEITFTKFFSDLGFKWDVYMDTSRYEDYYYSPGMYAAAEMIKKDRCPVVKRRAFFTDYTICLQNSCGESSQETYEAIKEYSDYDTKLIWDNVLRLQNLADIHRIMHQDYFLPVRKTGHSFRKNEAILFVFGRKELFDFLKTRYIAEIPEEVKLVFYSGQESYIEKIKMAADDAREFEYAGILCLDDPEKDAEPQSNAWSLLYQQIKNIAASPSFIGNVLDTFAENQCLGLAVPPVPTFGNYFERIQDGWRGHLADVKEALRHLGFDIQILPGTHPVYPAGGSFWIRSELLAFAASCQVGEKAGSDEVFRLLIPYIIQKKLYYTGVLYNADYAAIEMSNEEFMLREMNKALFKKYVPDYYDRELMRIRGELQ